MNRIIKKLGVLFIINFSLFKAVADDWTLGVMEFSFKQSQSRTQSSEKAAQVLPQLIVEQIANQEVRTIPETERLDRKLNELQTERLSLFLQLSKEYKTRDSLVLTKTSPRSLTKAIREQMKKIREIEIKIDENLENVKKAKAESEPKIQREKEIAEGAKVEEKQSPDAFFPFQLPFQFFRVDEKNQVVTEDVVLYKNDSTALFAPSKDAMEAGFTSWTFEQEATGAKINGLVTGEITCYGDYCSVTTNLRIYPGGKIMGTVTEVGLLSDLMPMANSIARSLDSKIANALPVLLEFDIEPKEIAKFAKVSIDGVVFSLSRPDGHFNNKTVEESGLHHITIEAPEYEQMAFSYSFTDDSHFFIHANLVPKVSALAHIHLKKYRDGVFHTYGLNQAPVTKEQPFAQLEVNGKSVLGFFTVPKIKEDDSDSSNIAFFQIPEGRAFDGANLVVNAKPFDRAANIDKRRRWMYTAYTALICSLPFTFYYLGEFTAENNAYMQGRGDKDRLLDLQNKANTMVGITAVCGVWAGIELIRYLWAADRVLPAQAKIDKKTKFSFETFVPDSAAEAAGEQKTDDSETEKIIETDEKFVQ